MMSLLLPSEVDSVVAFINNTMVSIHELEAPKKEILISPNPVTDQLSFEIEGGVFVMPHKFIVTNNQGAIVMEFFAETRQTMVPVDHLPSGIYYLRGGEYFGEFVINHP